MQHPRPRNLGSGEMISPIMDINHQARMGRGRLREKAPSPTTVTNTDTIARG